MAANTNTITEETPYYGRRDPERWRASNLQVRYDRKADILYVYALPIEPAGGVYVDEDDELLGLMSLKTREMIGYQVENFRSVWLKKHPEAQAAFRSVNSPVRWAMRRAWADFAAVIVNSLIRESPDTLPRASAPR